MGTIFIDQNLTFPDSDYKDGPSTEGVDHVNMVVQLHAFN